LEQILAGSQKDPTWSWGGAGTVKFKARADNFSTENGIKQLHIQS
jgi:hypothetical protein